MDTQQERDKKIHIGLYHFSMIVITIASFMVIYISYLLFYPFKVIELNTKAPTVYPVVVKPGELIHIRFDYCKYIDAPSHFTFSFIDHQALPNFSTITDFQIGCHIRVIDLTVPLVIDHDTILILISDKYQINSLNTVEYQWKTNVIKVE